MKLEIFEKNTRTRVDIIRVYNYVTYEDEFSDRGRFEIRIPLKDNTTKWLYQYGDWILFDEGVLGIIKGVRDVEDNDTEISVYGYLSNHILEFRSFLLTSVYYDTPPKIAFSMVDNLFINPDDERRKIGFLRASGDLPGWSNKIRYQNTGDTCLQALQEMLSPYDLGFELYPIIKNYNSQTGQNANLDKFEFRVIKPTDRTLGNTLGNTPVVFSFENNNLQQLEYEEDGQNFASVAIVASEGAGQERVTLEVPNTDIELTGYERIELYVDARDLQSEQEPEPEPTPEPTPEPAIYTKVEYVKNTRKVSLNLGAYLSSFDYGAMDEGNRKVEITMKVDYTTVSPSHVAQLIWCKYYDSSSDTTYSHQLTIPLVGQYESFDFTKLRFVYINNKVASTWDTYDNLPGVNSKRKITLSLMDKKFSIDESERDYSEIFTYNPSLRGSVKTTEFEIGLGGTNLETQYNYALMRFYEIKVYNQDGELMNYFYPVIQNSTGDYGLYDAVNDTFVLLDSNSWEVGPTIQEEEVIPDVPEQQEETNEIDEKLQQMMIERGKEKLQSAQKFITFDASIIEGRYEYGKDFYKGDYVSVVDKNTNRIYNVQVTSVKKTYSNGVEHRDITLGTDRMKIRRLQEKRLLTLLNAQGG